MSRPPRPRHTPKGRVITFYSYKGGTGRSMAVANVAWMLAMSGERVLIVDWDLEAPGIHRYFHPFLDDKELTSTVGLIDYVEKLRTYAISKEKLGPDETDVVEYIKRLKWPAEFSVQWEHFGPFAGIDLLPAGRQGPAYSTKLNTFNWIDFYEKLGGSYLLEQARQQLKSEYDYVLIDSRTGVSDTSGICTVEMPDTLVVCFTLNDQSINGASGVAESVLMQRKTRDANLAAAAAAGAGAANAVNAPNAPEMFSETRPPVAEFPFRIFPVPTRVEIGSERDKRQLALTLAQQKFAPFLDHLPKDDAPGKYWGRVQLAYFAFYAFEEIPAVFGDTADEELSLSTPIKRIARAITGDNTLSPVALAEHEHEAERLRKEILSWYLRKAVTISQSPVQAAQRVYDELDRDAKVRMRAVLLRLVQIVPGSAPSPVTVPKEDFDGGLAGMLDQLAGAGVVQMSGTAAVVDRNICENWDPLRQWLKEDEDFLLWRQNFSSAVSSWQRSGRDKSALLRGKLLDDAIGRLDHNPEYFTASERRFLAESRREAESDAVKMVFTVPFTSIRLEVTRRGLLVVGFVGLVLIAGIYMYEQLSITKKARSAAIVTLAQDNLSKDPLVSALLLAEVRDFAATETDRKFALQLASAMFPETVVYGSHSFVALEFARDGKSIVTAGANGAEIWATDTWKHTLLPSGPVIAASFNGWKPDRAKSRGATGQIDKVVTTGEDGSVQVWTLDGKQIMQVAANPRFSSDLCRKKLGDYPELGKPLYARFSPDEVVVAIAYHNGTLVMVNPANGNCFDAYPSYGTHPVAFSPDGEWAAIESKAGTRLFHVQDWQETPASSSTSKPLAVSFTGLVLTPESVVDLRPGYVANASHKGIDVGSFSWDSKSIAGGWANQGYWFSAPHDTRELFGHTAMITAVAFDPAGTHIYTTSMDKTIRVWPTQRKPPSPIATWPELVDFLRNSTRACLTVEQRRQLLNEDEKTATANTSSCLSRQR